MRLPFALGWFGAVVGLTMACGPAAVPAAPSSAPLSRMDGYVVRVDGAPASEPEAYVRLVVQTEGRLVHVELAPGWYLDEQGLRFSKEDVVSIDGERRSKGGRDVIVARRVRGPQGAVELRDENGEPVWR
jgi:hypothetical protein